MNRIITIAISVMIGTAVSARERPDVVAGNLWQFNDNGSWSLPQNGQVAVDIRNHRLLVGSVACSLGAGGALRSGNVEAVHADLITGSIEQFVFRTGDPDTFRCDDRQTPSFIIRPDGGYCAMYAPCFRSATTYYRIFSRDSWSGWGDEIPFTRSSGWPGGPDFQTACSNLIYLSSEKMMYDFIAGKDGSSHFMVSRDSGSTWSYGGLLLKAPDNGEFENNFTAFTGNGVDRIDMIVTERRKNNAPAAIYHGSIRGQEVRTSTDTVVGLLFDTLAVARADQLTNIFPDGTALKGSAWRPCRNTDVRHYSGDTVAAVVIARNDGGSGSADTAYLFVYCLFDGKVWKQLPVAGAGMKGAAAEEEHAGSAVLDPLDRNIVYISSTRDPRNDSSLGVYELFKGVTADRGATWQWTPVTGNSDRDNLHPVVPAWDGNDRALIWLRGSRRSARQYDASIVGIIEHAGETAGKKTYVDAGHHNLINACGVDSLDLSVGDTTGGPDYRWHERAGYGNNGTVIVSAEEPGGEDAPPIKEGVDIADAGIYDFWANFWGRPDTRSDWQIAAGLAPNAVQIFRQMACRTVDAGEYAAPPSVNSGDSLFLYQAYAGRDTVGSGEHVYVYIDDHVGQTGIAYAQEGDGKRTWFDGISYAPVVPAGRIAGKKVAPVYSPQLKLHPVSSRSLIKVIYSIDRHEAIDLSLFDMRGRLVQSHSLPARQAGTYATAFSAERLTAGVYLCRLTAGKSATTATVKILR